MNRAEASIANRILLFCFMIFCGLIFWSFLGSVIAEATNMRLGVKVLGALVFGSAFIADRAYVRIFR